MSDKPQRVALVTGAGRGIGRATAVRLSGMGYAVGLVARTRSQLDETAALCGGPTRVIAGDVADAKGVAAAIDETVAAFGRLDVLISNAGVAPLVPLAEMTDEQIAATIDTNLTATIRFARAAWPHLAASKGVIVNVSSESARDPFPGFSVYGAAKAGVNLFTKALAKEGAAAGVRVYAVAPAGVETALLRSIVSAEAYPTEMTLSPDDVAQTIAACIAGDLRHAGGETIYVHKRA